MQVKRLGCTQTPRLLSPNARTARNCVHKPASIYNMHSFHAWHRALFGWISCLQDVTTCEWVHVRNAYQCPGDYDLQHDVQRLDCYCDSQMPPAQTRSLRFRRCSDFIKDVTRTRDLDIIFLILFLSTVSICGWDCVMRTRSVQEKLVRRIFPASSDRYWSCMSGAGTERLARHRR